MATRWVLAQPESVAAVRRDISGDLLPAGVLSEVVDDVVLVASELIGNAVRHARSLASGRVRVSWEHDAAGITVSVTDGGGPQRPRSRRADPQDTTGRGLAIVSALADFWGVKRGPGTVTVWAHVPGTPQFSSASPSGHPPIR
jgi:anti-sigma regulatory factor (Ser/Thr protein kinase)